MDNVNKIKLSIIVPVYNVEKYLDECLTSILCQNDDFDEIILINDGSTDESQKICEKYCLQNPKIILVNQNNQGLATARNIGLKRVTGDYVVFIDSDDYINSQMSYILKKYLNTYNVDVLYYNASIQYDILTTEKAMTHSTELDYCKIKGSDYLYKAFPESYSSVAYLATYRTEFLKKYNILFPTGTYFEDNLFSLKVALEAQNILCIPDKLYIRRCRANSIMTGEVNIKKCMDMVSTQQSMWKYLKDKKIDIDNMEFTGRFVLAGILYAIGYLGQAVNEVDRNVQIKKLVYTFFEIWMPLFSAEMLSFNQVAAMSSILYEIEKWNRNERMDFINTFWNSEELYLKMFRMFKRQLKQETTDRMRKLPFYRKGYRIGLYGIGRHTKAILSLYKRLVGEIKCELYFIVTQKNCDKFFNRPVFSASECGEFLDKIVISSKLYQQDMRENLIQQGINQEKMILLYQRGDIFDFTVIDKLLIEMAVNHL